jgi:hypothetical protein
MGSSMPTSQPRRAPTSSSRNGCTKPSSRLPSLSRTSGASLRSALSVKAALGSSSATTRQHETRRAWQNQPGHHDQHEAVDNGKRQKHSSRSRERRVGGHDRLLRTQVLFRTDTSASGRIKSAGPKHKPSPCTNHHCARHYAPRQPAQPYVSIPSSRERRW